MDLKLRLGLGLGLGFGLSLLLLLLALMLVLVSRRRRLAHDLKASTTSGVAADPNISILSCYDGKGGKRLGIGQNNLLA